MQLSMHAPNAPLTASRQVHIKFVSITLIVAFLSLWQVRVTGSLSLIAFTSLILIIFLCLAYGHLFLIATAGVCARTAGLSFQFLCGFFVFNTLLYAMALASPFGMTTNIAILAFVAVVGIALSLAQRRDIADTSHEFPNFLTILVSGTAATLWCGDAHAPLLIRGETAIFQIWPDVFIHAREISVFAQAHGIGTIHDIKLAGAPAAIYHFASYLSAAAISALAGIPAIDTYSSFQLPFGIFLTGLAAFALISPIFGRWPGLAATVAVVLLPDAYQQGFGNRYLSYNFLAQANLGMLYGIACMAIAWVFVLDGCRRGKLLTVLLGYVFLAICLFYKAHIFVANSFLMSIYPCLFFAGILPRWRVLIGITFVSLFVFVAGYSQTISRVPVLRLDGSGIGGYVMILLGNFDAGVLKVFFTRVFTLERHSKPVEAFYIAAMLLMSTFGLWIAATAVAIFAGKSRISKAFLLFPVLITANYLAMAMGLALDTRGVGTVDELVNRPLVWAYFAVVAWTAGAGYHLAIGDGVPQQRTAIIGLLGLLCFAFATPIFLAQNLQTFPARQGFATYSQSGSVPMCLVKASQYLRDNSRSGEIIQDSANDPRFIVTALSERQLFVGEGKFGGHIKESQERLRELLSFTKMQSIKEVSDFAASRNISWYLMHPGTAVSWPAAFLQHPAFDCDGYRIYHFVE